jgi:hypothetical protein
MPIEPTTARPYGRSKIVSGDRVYIARRDDSWAGCLGRVVEVVGTTYWVSVDGWKKNYYNESDLRKVVSE